MNTLVMLLPGTAVTYNGEEIGLTDGLIRWDQTVDPWGKQAGIENYEMKSRDFSRTPFHWNNKQNAGEYFYTNTQINNTIIVNMSHDL